MKKTIENTEQLIKFLTQRRKDLGVSQRELAKILGATPEALSRTLRKMSNEGILTVDGRMITILNRQAMEELADQIRRQVDKRRYRTRTNPGRTAIPRGSYFVPDLIVIPTSLLERRRGQPDRVKVEGNTLVDVEADHLVLAGGEVHRVERVVGHADIGPVPDIVPGSPIGIREGDGQSGGDDLDGPGPAIAAK